MKENEKRLKPKKANALYLNRLAKHAYSVCKRRGKDSNDRLDFLKYLAGEVVEATEVCKGSKKKFASELADVIMTCLIIMHKYEMDATQALLECHIKNMGKIQDGKQVWTTNTQKKK